MVLGGMVYAYNSGDILQTASFQLSNERCRPSCRPSPVYEPNEDDIRRSVTVAALRGDRITDSVGGGDWHKTRYGTGFQRAGALHP